MDIEKRVFADVVVLRPKGRIDQESAPSFQETLVDAVGSDGPTKVALDFADVGYISSVGLRAIMVASKQSKAAKGRLAVAALTPTVNEVFEISRFNYVVEIFPELRDALSALSEAAVQAYEHA